MGSSTTMGFVSRVGSGAAVDEALGATADASVGPGLAVSVRGATSDGAALDLKVTAGDGSAAVVGGAVGLIVGATAVAGVAAFSVASGDECWCFAGDSAAGGFALA